MKKPVAGLLLCLVALQATAADVESKPGYEALQDVVKRLSVCTDTSDYTALFIYSLDGTNAGAHPEETVSAANEKVFLACPKDFMTALMRQRPKDISLILHSYFGIAYPPWDVAEKLCPLQKDPQVGAFVRAHFADEISTYTDAHCKPQIPESSDD